MLACCLLACLGAGARYAESFDANFNDMGIGMSAAAADVLAANVEHKAVKTVVTYDKGGVWNFIRPPRVDANGQPVTCAAQVGAA